MREGLGVPPTAREGREPLRAGIYERRKPWGDQFMLKKHQRRITVIVVDDTASYRYDLARAIANHAALELVAESGDVGLALKLIASHQPEVVVLDPGSGGGGGLDALERLRMLAPACAVILCTDLTDAHDLAKLRRPSAASIVSRHEEPSETCERIVGVAAAASTNALGCQLAISDYAADPVPALTAREHEILRLTAEGNLVPDIARNMHLSNSTIKAHNRSLYGKLGVHERAAAVSAAYQCGLLP